MVTSNVWSLKLLSRVHSRRSEPKHWVIHRQWPVFSGEEKKNNRTKLLSRLAKTKRQEERRKRSVNTAGVAAANWGQSCVATLWSAASPRRRSVKPTTCEVRARERVADDFAIPCHTMEEGASSPPLTTSIKREKAACWGEWGSSSTDMSLSTTVSMPPRSSVDRCV